VTVFESTTTTTTIATNATQGIVCKHGYMDKCKVLCYCLGVAKKYRGVVLKADSLLMSFYLTEFPE